MGSVSQEGEWVGRGDGFNNTFTMWNTVGVCVEGGVGGQPSGEATVAAAAAAMPERWLVREL